MGTFSHGLSLCSWLLHMHRKLTPLPSLLVHTTSPVDLGVPHCLLAPLLHWRCRGASCCVAMDRYLGVWDLVNLIQK